MFLDRKIPPPAIAIISALLMLSLSLAQPQPVLSNKVNYYAVIIFLFIGLTLDTYSIWIFLRVKTTINPLEHKHASQLVTTGFYRITRNPMYLGLACLLVAWGVYLNAVLPFIMVFIFVIYLTKYQIIPEERELKSIFGYKYIEYLNTTRRWI